MPQRVRPCLAGRGEEPVCADGVDGVSPGPRKIFVQVDPVSRESSRSGARPLGAPMACARSQVWVIVSAVRTARARGPGPGRADSP